MNWLTRLLNRLTGRNGLDLNAHDKEIKEIRQESQANWDQTQSHLDGISEKFRAAQREAEEPIC
jgi:hypothetical protein